MKVIVSGAVEPDQAVRLAELARAADRTVSAELRRAVREHLEREHNAAAAKDAA